MRKTPVAVALRAHVRDIRRVTQTGRIVLAAYLGNFSQTFTSECHIALALEANGCEVTRLQEDVVSLREIDEATWGADLFLWTRTDAFLRANPGDMIAWIDRKRALGLPTVSLHLDLYAGLRRGEGLRSDPFWRTEYVFTPDGGSPEFFKRHGVNHFYLRPGVHGPECQPGTSRREFAADVVFVGSGSAHGAYHPEWGYRRELLAWLAKTYGPRFVKHGNPPSTRGRSFIRGQDLNDLYASARVVVGDTLCLGPEDAPTPRFTHERYFSDRAFETVGRGGFLIHPWIKGLDDEMKDSEHLAYYRYGDFDGLKRTIDHYLDHDDERRRIQAQGQAFVRENCTYTHRTGEMLRVLAEQSSGIAEALA